MHGSHVALVEGVGGGRKNFEDSQGTAEMAQRGSHDGADPETPAAAQIHPRIAFSVVAQHHLAGSHTFGRYPRVSLQAYADIGGGAASTGPADHFVSSAQGDGRAGGARKSLGALRNYVDGGFEVAGSYFQGCGSGV